VLAALVVNYFMALHNEDTEFHSAAVAVNQKQKRCPRCAVLERLEYITTIHAADFSCSRYYSNDVQVGIT